MTRQETRLLWLLAGVQLTILLDFMVLMPVGPLLMKQLDMDAAQLGQVVSAYTFASAACGFLGARFVDRFERRRALLALYALFGLATAGCALASSPLGLLVARIVAGGAAGLVWAVALALLIDVFPPERRGHALGVVMSAYAVAAVAGVPAGLAASSVGGAQAPFVLVLLLSVLVGAGLVAALPARTMSLKPARAAYTARWAIADYLGWALTFGVVFAGFLLIPFLGTFMVQNLGLEPADLSWVYFAGGAASFVTARLIGALVDRVGAPLILGALLTATVLPHLLFTHQTTAALPKVIGLFVLFMTLTSGRVIPTIALITRDLSPEQRGRFMAINTAVSDVASGAAAWLGGVLLQSSSAERLEGFGRLGWLAVSCSCVCLLILAARVLVPREQRAGEPACSAQP